MVKDVVVSNDGTIVGPHAIRSAEVGNLQS